jgi:D-sedoheptulose 7-phosphate isomerase
MIDKKITNNIFKKNILEHQKLVSKLEFFSSDVNLASNLIESSLKNNGCIFFCGNGGSAADSQHLAAEFTGRFVRERKAISGLALTTDTSTLTAIGNDYGYDEIFARQIEGLAKSGDCLVVISTSGNSTNIVRAIHKAKEIGVYTVGLLGKDGGKIKDMCDVSVVVPSQSTARIQEMHILIGHTWCEVVDELF